jgi:O-antigen ligase
VKKLLAVLAGILLQFELTPKLFNVESGLLLITVLFAVVCLAVLLIYKNKIGAKSISPIFLWLLGLLFLMVTSLMWTNAPNYGMRKTLIVAVTSISAIPIAVVIKSEYRTFWFAFRMTAALVLVYIYISISDPYSLFSTFGEHDRFGVSSGAIMAGRYFGLNALIFIYSAARSKNIYITMIQILFILGELFYCVLSGSKGPLVALFLIGTFQYYLITRTDKKLASWVFPACLTLSIVLIFSIDMVQSSDFIRVRFIENFSSYNSRITLFKLGIDSIDLSSIGKFLFGAGIGDYGFVEHSLDLSGYPHNILVEALYENGLIGLVLLGLILIKISLSAFKKGIIKSQFHIILLISIYYIVNSMVSGDLSLNSSIFKYYIMFHIFYNSYGSENLHSLSKT